MHHDGYFDEHVAAEYDESVAEMFDPAVVDPVVDFLVRLSGTGNGRALELGTGTGRTRCLLHSAVCVCTVLKYRTP